jgi:hypothetical protein
MPVAVIKCMLFISFNIVILITIGAFQSSIFFLNCFKIRLKVFCKTEILSVIPRLDRIESSKVENRRTRPMMSLCPQHFTCQNTGWINRIHN